MLLAIDAGTGSARAERDSFADAGPAVTTRTAEMRDAGRRATAPGRKRKRPALGRASRDWWAVKDSNLGPID